MKHLLNAFGQPITDEDRPVDKPGHLVEFRAWTATRKNPDGTFEHGHLVTQIDSVTGDETTEFFPYLDEALRSHTNPGPYY